MREDSLSIWEAMELVCAKVKEMDWEVIPMMESLGRILAEPVITQIYQPPFPRSAMDGYAIHHEDLARASEEHPVTLPVVGCQYAGDAYFRPLQRGEALRIMTGAAIPAGADAVIRQEDTDYGEEVVNIYTSVKEGANYCPVGEDFPLGDVLAEAGDQVDAYLIAAAVAGGISTVKVRKEVRAAIITTGDELQEMGSPLKEGKIYNSNLALFGSRLKQLGCQVVLAKAAGDDMDVILQELRNALVESDLIITTGGVSVGIKDLLPVAMESLGAEVVFHGIAIKPGMPTMFSVLEGKPILSLSGNPYSASAVFELLVQPMIKKMTGRKKEVLKAVFGIARDSFPKKTGCTRFLRGYYEYGSIYFSLGQRNGQTKAGIGANCLIHLEAGRDPIQEGDSVEALLLYE